MKRIALVLVVLLVFAMTASAQNQIKPVFYAGGGVGIPLSPSAFSDAYKMGFGFGGGIGAQFTPNVELIGKFFYNMWSIDEDEWIGPDFKLMEFGADAKYIFTTAPDAMFGPFVIVGVGMGNAKWDDYSETKFAFSGGAGFDYMFSPKAGIWVEARYGIVLTEGESTGYLPIRAGVKVLFGE